MSNNNNILKNVPANQKAKLQETIDELTMGMLMLKYEEFDLSFEDDTSTATASFINDNHVIVAYLSSADVIDIKITDLNHTSIKFRTKMIRGIGLRDLPAILRVFV